jgi:hypothetical protein
MTSDEPRPAPEPEPEPAPDPGPEPGPDHEPGPEQRPLQGPPPPPAYGPPSFGPPDGRVNGFAVAALVVGIVGLCCCFGFLGIIFGNIARRQIEESGQAGAGLATAGIVLGWIALALAIVRVLALAGAGAGGY